MPDWFYPLMLVVILAGYVFLFIQGRATAGMLDAMERRLDSLESALRARVEPASGAPEVVESPVDTVGPRLDELQRLLAGQGVAIERLAEAVEDGGPRPETPASARAPAPALLTDPEEIARTFLLGEGFSSIRFLGLDDAEEGVRIRIGALRGNEVRQGHVIVADGKVTDAVLEVPTSLFP